jgi:uncharacterized membrane protein (Fun14 family)
LVAGLFGLVAGLATGSLGLVACFAVGVAAITFQILARYKRMVHERDRDPECD